MDTAARDALTLALDAATTELVRGRECRSSSGTGTAG